MTGPMASAGGERRALGAMLLACLLWGGTFVAIRDTVAEIPPALLVAWRFLCAGMVYAGLLLLRQRPRPRLVVGIGVALAGSALLTLREGLVLGRGELLTLAGAAMFALQIVAISRWAPVADPVALVCVQSFTASAALLPFAGPPQVLFDALAGATRWNFLYLVVAGSVIAPLLQVLAQRSLSAGRIGLLFALEPVFALVFALTIGAETFALRWWLGAVLILGAVVLVEARTD